MALWQSFLATRRRDPETNSDVGRCGFAGRIAVVASTAATAIRPATRGAVARGVVSAPAPIVGPFSPDSGSNITPSTIVSFPVTNKGALFTQITVVAFFADLGISELVHDGVSFGPKYSNPSNIRTTILDGFQYQILRDNGWPDRLTITVYAVNNSGVEA